MVYSFNFLPASLAGYTIVPTTCDHVSKSFRRVTGAIQLGFSWLHQITKCPEEPMCVPLPSQSAISLVAQARGLSVSPAADGVRPAWV